LVPVEKASTPAIVFLEKVEWNSTPFPEVIANNLADRRMYAIMAKCRPAEGMIHIIGVDRYYQVSTDAKREGAASKDIARFQRYLSTAAKRLGAQMIAEQASEEWVDGHGPGALSVARRVAVRNNIRHRYCEPDASERQACGLKTEGELWDIANGIAMRTCRNIVEVWREEISKSVEAWEAVWLSHLKIRGLDKMAVVFVCGADHAETFKAVLRANGIEARIHCRNWPDCVSGERGGGET
jgi:hypothetical protein